MTSNTRTDFKVIWLNSEFIENATLEKIKDHMKSLLMRLGLWEDSYEHEKEDWYDKFIALLQTNAATMLDFEKSGSYLFLHTLAYNFDVDALHTQLQKEDVDLEFMLPEIVGRLMYLEDFIAGKIQEEFKNLSEKYKRKTGILCNAARVALTGQAVGANLFEIVELLGKETSLHRLEWAANYYMSDVKGIYIEPSKRLQWYLLGGL